jgi:hypothetical protein
MLTKLKAKLIQLIFEKLYKNFDYPFESADYLISKLTKSQLEQYYADINNWRNSRAYQIENTEFKKMLYKELALKTSSNISMAGYRLAMIMKRKEEERFEYLSKKAAIEEKVDKIINT